MCRVASVSLRYHCWVEKNHYTRDGVNTTLRATYKTHHSYDTPDRARKAQCEEQHKEEHDLRVDLALHCSTLDGRGSRVPVRLQQRFWMSKVKEGRPTALVWSHDPYKQPIHSTMVYCVAARRATASDQGLATAGWAHAISSTPNVHATKIHGPASPHPLGCAGLGFPRMCIANC